MHSHVRQRARIDRKDSTARLHVLVRLQTGGAGSRPATQLEQGFPVFGCGRKGRGQATAGSYLSTQGEYSVACDSKGSQGGPAAPSLQ